MSLRLLPQLLSQKIPKPSKNLTFLDKNIVMCRCLMKMLNICKRLIKQISQLLKNLTRITNYYSDEVCVRKKYFLCQL